MKRKELEQFKTRTVAELEKNLAEYRDKLWTLRTDLAAGKVKNVKEINSAKKAIALILTLTNQAKQKNG